MLTKPRNKIASAKTPEDCGSYKLDSFIKGYHVYHDIWSPELFEELTAVREPQNIVDKYAVSVTKAGKVVGHLMKGKTGRFAKIIFYFMRADKQNSCTTVVTGRL